MTLSGFEGGLNLRDSVTQTSPAVSPSKSSSVVRSPHVTSLEEDKRPPIDVSDLNVHIAESFWTDFQTHTAVATVLVAAGEVGGGVE